ncbi:isochorismate synthase [Aureibaculum conchae]|uniref:isochorismate synthase n=1 Tax=Aureibaculum sp. 2308TA14-22 TaxID=3108392 RepID=UPI00339B97B2
MDVNSTLAIILKKAEDALKSELPFVVYRHPKSDFIKAIFQKTDTLFYAKDYQESGFVFAPFDNREPSILFPFSESARFNAEIIKSFIEDKRNETILESSSEDSKAKHIDLVKEGIKFLEKNNFKKVVLSRKETIMPKKFDVIEGFKKLLLNYKHAFVYCWFHPKVGLWLGATPETLLNVTNNTFSTMALAGTQIYGADSKVVWKPKEVEEQQLVTDFILHQLAIDVEVSIPYTVKAGSLLHLRTDISGKLTKNFTLNKIINLLHPTPAVCGVPKQEAKDFILQNEKYSRQFYTGFLGELNLNKTSNLYVNLRCMQLLNDQIEIYVGGGITKDSNPESEWKETVAKSKVMMYILH